MIWVLPIISIILFYAFALLQNSFFIYFNLFGSVPNLIFVLFFILVFFSKKNSYYGAVFFAVLAGLFLDIFSSANLGISVALLIVIGVSIKKIQSLLNEKDNDYPFGYFLSLFLISLLAYYLLLKTCLFFLTPNAIVIAINQKLLAEIVYSLFFAIIGFLVCKKFVKQKPNRDNFI